MKTRLIATLGLVALAIAAFTSHGIQSAEATPGSGAPTIGGIGATPFYPLQCKTVKQTRVGVNATAAVNVPATPLVNRNWVQVCLSPESLTLVDAGYVGSYAKVRFDNGVPGIGVPFLLDAGAAPGTVLAFSTLPTSMGPPVCSPQITTQAYIDGGPYWVQGVASFNLLDGGPQVFLDATECAF